MAADPIVTTTQLAAYQGGDPQSLIDQATALVRAWCGWHVTPSKTETLELEVDGSTFLPLPSLHVTGVTSVVMDSVTLVQDTDYQWSQAGVLTHLAPNGTAWTTPATVTLTHGFDEAPELAAVIMAIVSRAQKSPDNVTRATEGGVSEMYSQTTQGAAGGVALLQHEKDILRRYRIPVI